MTITGRCLVVAGLLALLVACGNGDDSGDGGKTGDDYRAMSPDEVCALLPTDKARDLMKAIDDEELTATKETSVKLPACRYGSDEGKPYLRISIYQTSHVKTSDEYTKKTVAGQDALERDADGSCSVLITLDENLYLLALAESWDPDKQTCPVARDALETAYPNLTK